MSRELTLSERVARLEARVRTQDAPKPKTEHVRHGINQRSASG